MSKIYIWGTGRLSAQVMEFKISIESITGFIDNDPSKTEYMGLRVYRPKEIAIMEYDAILIANIFVDEIIEQCRKIGIDLEKVIFLFDHCRLLDLNQDYKFIENTLGIEMADELKSSHYVIKGSSGDDYKEYIGEKETIFIHDYVRIKTFQLAVEEVQNNNIQGSVAELGVFQGEFAQYINAAFPDRNCYLFDTFDGYGEEEVNKEIERGNSNLAIAQVYKNTNIELVMSKMPFKKKILIKRGYFPESLDGLEELFAFVSIDVNYETSIYNGLVYFYPRLSPGGYIFIHDYRTYYKGVKEAVYKFERDYNVLMCKVPLCDKNGSLIITK